MKTSNVVCFFFAAILCFCLIQCRPKSPSNNRWEIFKSNLQKEVDSVKTDFEKTSIIRSRMAELIDIPDGSRNDIDVLYPDNRTFDMNRYVNIFEGDSAGALCGTTTHILKKVYEDFGYRCRTLNVGDKEHGLSHVVCLVMIKHNGKGIEIIQDATYNFSFIDTAGEPIAYAEFIQMPQKGKWAEFERTDGVVYCDALIDSLPTLTAHDSVFCLQPLKIEKLPSGKTKYRIPKTMDYLLLNCGSKGNQFLAMMERKGYTRDIFNLFLIDPVISD